MELVACQFNVSLKTLLWSRAELGIDISPNEGLGACSTVINPEQLCFEVREVSNNLPDAEKI